MPYPKHLDKAEIYAAVSKRFASADTDTIITLMSLAETKDLNPLDNQLQLTFAKSKDSNGQFVTKGIVLIGIDGFRAIAARSGKYLGGTAPLFARMNQAGEIVWSEAWFEEWGFPIACKMGIYVKDAPEPTYSVVHFNEYAGYRKMSASEIKEGKKPDKIDNYGNAQVLSPIWATKFLLMLAKCCEAVGIRRACPDELSGLYTGDEFSGINGQNLINASTGSSFTGESVSEVDAVKVRKTTTPKPAENAPITPKDELMFKIKANTDLLGDDFLSEVRSNWKNLTPEMIETYTDAVNTAIQRNIDNQPVKEAVSG